MISAIFTPNIIHTLENNTEKETKKKKTRKSSIDFPERLIKIDRKNINIDIGLTSQTLALENKE